MTETRDVCAVLSLRDKSDEAWARTSSLPLASIRRRRSNRVALRECGSLSPTSIVKMIREAQWRLMAAIPATQGFWTCCNPIVSYGP